MLKKRVRDLEGKPIGMVVAISKDQIGYSICNVGAGDKYSDSEALDKAIARAKSQQITNLEFWAKVTEKQLKAKGYEKIFESNTMNEILNSNAYRLLHAIKILDEIKIMEMRAQKYFKI